MSSFVKASGGITPNIADPGEEFPFLHTITVVDRVVSVDKPELVQNNIKTETVTLNLDSEWEGALNGHQHRQREAGVGHLVGRTRFRHSRLQIRLHPCIPVAATITSLSDSTSGGIL